MTTEERNVIDAAVSYTRNGFYVNECNLDTAVNNYLAASQKVGEIEPLKPRAMFSSSNMPEIVPMTVNISNLLIKVQEIRIAVNNIDRWIKNHDGG